MSIGLGTWRFFLAFLVVISHLWSGMIHGPAAYAVWGFFVLSGYLMTYVLTEKYGPTLPGLRDYAFNRFLRIYPTYWLSCLIGVAALVILPRYGVTPSTLNPAFHVPISLSDWWLNLTLLPVFRGGNRLVPVSGALATEVGVYVLIPFMAFSRLAAWLALILTFTLNVRYGLTTDLFAVRYSSYLTCFVAFTVGSIVCHYRELLKKITAPRVSIVLWCLHCLVWIWYDKWPWTYGLYLSVLISAWVVVSLSAIKNTAMDTLLGDMSYPVYLFHTSVAIWFFGLFNGNRSLPFFLVSFLVTLLASWLVVQLVDKRVAVNKRRKDFHR